MDVRQDREHAEEEAQMVIAFASQRGGVTKTSLCVEMAGFLSAQAAPRPACVQVLDLDPQRIALSFAPALHALGASVAFPELEEVRGWAEGLPAGGVLLLDTPPTIGEEIALAVSVADVVVVPLTGRASLTGARDLHETLKAARLYKPGQQMLYVLNRQKTRTRHYAEAQAEIRNALGSQVLKAMIGDSVLWDEAMAACCPMMAWAPHHAAAREVRDVGQELWKRINGN